LVVVGHAVLFDEIQRLGLENNTYWFISSDHGYNLGNHRLPSNKFLLYDHSLRIPMVVKGPGIPSGVVLPILGTNVDYAPTWLGLADIDTPASMDGRSLLPALIKRPEDAPPADPQTEDVSGDPEVDGKKEMAEMDANKDGKATLTEIEAFMKARYYTKPEDLKDLQNDDGKPATPEDITKMVIAARTCIIPSALHEHSFIWSRIPNSLCF